MTRYVIAVCRGHRRRVDPEWVDSLAAIDGLAITGTASKLRVQVEATDEAIDDARARLGDAFLIEPVILHDPLDRG